jgi:glycosyltransferase involved in cell wall biosynthesis
VAQLLLAALRLAGHEPFIASRFRSFEGSGDPVRQARLAVLGRRVAARLLCHCRDLPGFAPELWFSYHVYHKAPDWLGPAITDELGIPYVVAEASVSPMQAVGPWTAGHRAAKCAIRRADAVIGLNSSDLDCVLPLLRDPSRWVAIKPFVDAACYDREVNPKVGPPHLITVAMMRKGDKLASYRILGDALSRLLDLAWSLEVIGDGPARADVEDALAPLKGRVVWRGSLSAAAVAQRLALADLCVWPAVNEAFGMALLEAQASGLPVVAGAGGGVGEIVVPEVTGLLVSPGDQTAFASAVRSLILDGGRRATLAAAARRRVRMKHDLSAAARRLGTIVNALGRAHTAKSKYESDRLLGGRLACPEYRDSFLDIS